MGGGRRHAARATLSADRSAGSGPAPDTTFETSFGTFELLRHIATERSTLRAWDAADAYAIEHLAETGFGPDAEPESKHVLLVNDASGALATAFASHPASASVTTLADSHLTHVATRANLERNGLDPAELTMLHSFEQPVPPLDLVVLKIPKSLGLLEDQLRLIRPAIGPETVILGAAMARHIHTSTLTQFESIIGTTTTSLAKRKARLIHVTPDPARDPGPAPAPLRHAVDLGRGTTITTVNHPNVFSRKRLDDGTRLLLDALARADWLNEHPPGASGHLAVVDLGCGNGVLGTALARQNELVHPIFTDVSFHAVASAEDTFREAFGDERDADFLVTDALAGVEAGSVDVVLCNPPYHEDRALGDDVAWQMFKESRDVLATGGELYVVGNRHLPHHAKLHRIFRNAEVVASNPKYVVMLSRA